jgi:hypothetical protein
MSLTTSMLAFILKMKVCAKNNNNIATGTISLNVAEELEYVDYYGLM